MDSIILKHKIDNFILIGPELDKLNGNDKLFNFWSNKIITKEIKKEIFPDNLIRKVLYVLKFLVFIHFDNLDILKRVVCTC